MTDLEMTKLCAGAMGIDHRYCEAGNPVNSAEPIYFPLHDDAQAMALVKRFKLDLDSPKGGLDDEWCAGYGDDHSLTCSPIFQSSRDLNRAIVECVAKMQSAKA